MLHRESEIREMADSIRHWRARREQLTKEIADIARDPRQVFMAGQNPERKIAEINAKIVEGNGKAELSKDRIRTILAENLAQLRSDRDTLIARNAAILSEVAPLLREAAERLSQIAGTSEVGLGQIKHFNAIAKEIEAQVVEGGEGGLPRAKEDLKASGLPYIDASACGGNPAIILRRMLEILAP